MRFANFLAVLPLAAGAPSLSRREEPAPLLEARGGQAIPGKFIVKFREGSPLSAIQNALSLLNGNADHVFKNVFSGFAASMNTVVVDMLRNHPDVCENEYNRQRYNADITLGRVH